MGRAVASATQGPARGTGLPDGAGALGRIWPSVKNESPAHRKRRRTTNRQCQFGSRGYVCAAARPYHAWRHSPRSLPASPSSCHGAAAAASCSSNRCTTVDERLHTSLISGANSDAWIADHDADCDLAMDTSVRQSSLVCCCDDGSVCVWALPGAVCGEDA